MAALVHGPGSEEDDAGMANDQFEENEPFKFLGL